MTTLKEVKPTGLEHIQDGHIDPSVLSQHCIDWSIGPVKVSACIDPSVPSASVNVTILGTSIGKCVLSPSHQDCTIGGSIAGFKVEAKFELKDDCLIVYLEVCAPFVGCTKYEHKLFCF